jgi:hypothetical protein
MEMIKFAGSCPILGQQIIDEFFCWLSERTFGTRLFDRLIIAPKVP